MKAACLRLVGGICLLILAMAARADVISSPNDSREYQLITLSNQLEVLLVSDPEARNSAATLAVPVGSMHNPDSQLGLAHYLEHMLFLGSERYPEINQYSAFMRLNGGYTNAYTAQDRTVYGFEVNDKVFSEALDRLGDVMRAPLLDEQYADKERSTVNAEHQTYKGSDGRKMFALQRYTLNPAHPMSRFSTGDLTTLKDKPDSILQNEMKQFFQQHYSADRMKAVLYGPRSIKEMAELAKARLTQIPQRSAPEKAFFPHLVTEKELAIEASLEPSSDIRILQASFVTPGVKEFYAFKPGWYLSRILGSDRDGSLSDYLQKEGLIEALVAGFDDHYGPADSLVNIKFQLTEKGLKQQDEILAAMFAYIELIREQGVNEVQFQAMATSLENSFTWLQKSAGFNYAMSLAASMLQYPEQDLIYHNYRLDGFKPELIHDLLSYLTPERVRLFVAHPGVKGDKTLFAYDASYKVAPIAASRMQQWQKQQKPLMAKLSLPEGNRWLAKDKSIVPAEHQQQASELISRPGLSVWFKQSEHFQEPKGTLNLQLNTDLADRSPQQRMMMAVLNEVLSKKLMGLNYEASEANLSLSVSDSNGLLFSTSGFTDKQGELMLALLDQVKMAEFSKQELHQAKVEIRRLIDNKQKGQSMNLAFSEFRRLVRLPSWTDEVLLKGLSEINISTLSAFRDQLYNESAVRLLATGNFSSAEIKTLADSVLKRAPAKQPDFYQLSRVKPEAKRRVSRAAESEMGDAALGYIFVSPMPGDKGLVQAELLNKIAYSDFYDQIRTQEQLAYSPFTASFPIGEYAAIGLFTQSPEKGPAYLQQRFEHFARNFGEKLKQYDEKAYLNIRQAYIANFTKKPGNLGEEFAYISQRWLTGKTELDNKKARLALLEATTLADVQQFYQQTILGEQNEQYLVQVRGSNFKDAPLGKLKNEYKVDNLERWQAKASAQ